MSSLQSTKTILESNDYQQKINNELSFYQDCLDVHNLPDIFHYWSNKYLRPKQEQFGFSNPDDFFVSQCLAQSKRHPSLNILSIGAGNGELEVHLAKQLKLNEYNNFTITCLDINSQMLERSQQAAHKAEVDQHIIT